MKLFSNNRTQGLARESSIIIACTALCALTLLAVALVAQIFWSEIDLTGVMVGAAYAIVALYLYALVTSALFTGEMHVTALIIGLVLKACALISLIMLIMRAGEAFVWSMAAGLLTFVPGAFLYIHRTGSKTK